LSNVSLRSAPPFSLMMIENIFRSSLENGRRVHAVRASTTCAALRARANRARTGNVNADCQVLARKVSISSRFEPLAVAGLEGPRKAKRRADRTGAATENRVVSAAIDRGIA
jgi:hypothetical protein